MRSLGYARDDTAVSFWHLKFHWRLDIGNWKLSSMVRSHSQSADRIFLSLAGLLVLFGLVMLSSASTIIGYQRFQDSYYFVKQQITHGVIPGLILFFIFRYIPYRLWKQYAVWGYAAAVFLL